MGLALIVCSKGILSFYSLSSLAYTYTLFLLVLTGFVLWIKVSNIVLITGIIRSGGDTKFSMFLDLAAIWVLGIPMGLIMVFVFHLSVAWPKSAQHGNKTVLPLSMQAHHAVADGLQIARFFNETEIAINELADLLMNTTEI
jgi:Na+-driven multidrug efflux pump